MAHFWEMEKELFNQRPVYMTEKHGLTDNPALWDVKGPVSVWVNAVGVNVEYGPTLEDLKAGSQRVLHHLKNYFDKAPLPIWPM